MAAKSIKYHDVGKGRDWMDDDSPYRDIYHVEIFPGSHIVITGEERNVHGGPRPINKTFRVGDQAEFDRYNTSFYGPILKITKKTVVIKKYASGSAHLDPFNFARRNYRFDFATEERRNAEYLD